MPVRGANPIRGAVIPQNFCLAELDSESRVCELTPDFGALKRLPNFEIEGYRHQFIGLGFTRARVCLEKFVPVPFDPGDRDLRSERWRGRRPATTEVAVQSGWAGSGGALRG